MATVRSPRNYDALRETHDKVEAEQEFANAGQATTARQEQTPAQQPPSPEPQTAVPYEDLHEAQREAYTKELQAKVDAKTIDRREMGYQLGRFEHGDDVARDRAAAAYDRAQQQQSERRESEQRRRQDDDARKRRDESGGDEGPEVEGSAEKETKEIETAASSIEMTENKTAQAQVTRSFTNPGRSGRPSGGGRTRGRS